MGNFLTLDHPLYIPPHPRRSHASPPFLEHPRSANTSDYSGRCVTTTTSMQDPSWGHRPRQENPLSFKTRNSHTRPRSYPSLRSDLTGCASSLTCRWLCHRTDHESTSTQGLPWVSKARRRPTASQILPQGLPWASGYIRGSS